MDNIPLDPDAFSAHVIALLLQQFPDRNAAVTGPLHVVFDGRHLGLENLYRMVLRDPGNAGEIVENYLDRLMEGDSVSNAPIPFAMARPRIMPRIQPESIFRQLDREQVAHVPFVNGTVIVFVIDLPQLTVSVTTEQMIRWGVVAEDLEQIARENLGRYSPDLPIQIVESREGGRAAILSRQDGYDAARLLLGHLHQRLSPELKGDFYVATPARDTFLALTCDPPEFVDRLRNRIGQDFRRLPYPITDHLFVVTRDGIAGTAA